jgi:hypothetical protein
MYCLIVQMWNSHTVMYHHVLVCTSTYRYVPICQILSSLRGTGFQMREKPVPAQVIGRPSGGRVVTVTVARLGPGRVDRK